MRRTTVVKLLVDKGADVNRVRSPILSHPLPHALLLLLADCCLLSGVSCLLLFDCCLVAAVWWLLAAGCWLLAAVYWLLAAGCWLLLVLLAYPCLYFLRPSLTPTPVILVSLPSCLLDHLEQQLLDPSLVRCALGMCRNGQAAGGEGS